MHRNALRLADHVLGDRPMPPFEPARPAALADHDLAGPQLPGLIDQRVADMIGRHRHERCAERRRQRQIVGQLLALRADDRARPAAFHHYGGPGRMKYVGHPSGMADDLRPAFAGAHRDHQSLARDEIALVARRAQLIGEAPVDATGGKAQRQFAQRRQLGGREEIGERSPRRVGQIDFARRQSLDQGIGGQVDNDQFGIVQYLVGHGFPHTDMGEARHDVIEAFDMLDIDRGGDIDPRRQQFLYILPPLGVSAARRIAMRQFIDQNQPRMPFDRGVDVELVQRMALMIDPMARQYAQRFQQQRRFATTMGFRHTDDDIHPLRLSPRRILQHAIGLTHAWRSTQIDGQTPALLLARQPQIMVGIGGGGGLGHRWTCSMASRDPAPD